MLFSLGAKCVVAYVVGARPGNSSCYRVVSPGDGSTHGPWMIFVCVNLGLSLVSVDGDSMAGVVRCTVFVCENPDNYDPAVYRDYELLFSKQCMCRARCACYFCWKDDG